MNDYLKFYDLERYLFDEVGPAFRSTGTIRPVDFYMVFIWKANRAKNKLRNRLKTRAGSFAEAVEQIALLLHASNDQKERLRILMADWGLQLPMASAILTVLYPNEFTVYDRRVCDELELKFRDWPPFSDAMWEEYRQFREAVIAATPVNLSLRDKDRFLWGRSLRHDAERDCEV